MIQFKMSTDKNTASKPIVSSTISKLLSATLLITAASTGCTAIHTATNNNAVQNFNNSNSTNDFDGYGNPNNYCDSETEAQTKHRKSQSKYQTSIQRAMDCMQTQLKVYQQPTMSARQQYFAYKSQAWLNYAYFESSIKSRTLAGTSALQEGEDILRVLKSGNEDDLDLIVDIPQTSALMRPDLWAQISALKDSGGIKSAPRELALSEVGVVWAAADYCEHGFRQSTSQFRMADRWLEQAFEAYVNANDSVANRALEDLTTRYFKQYEPLDVEDDICRGQVLSPNDQSVRTSYNAVDDNVIDVNAIDASIVTVAALENIVPEITPLVDYPNLK